MTTIPTAQQRDLALLSATARRHARSAPLSAITAVSAAVDELVDPLRLPPLLEFNDHDTADLAAVLGDVRARLIHSIQTAQEPGTALALGRAARELAAALQLLHTDRPTGQPQ